MCSHKNRLIKAILMSTHNISPHQGDSNGYTQYTIFDINKKITLNYPKSGAMGFFPRDAMKSLKQPW